MAMRESKDLKKLELYDLFIDLKAYEFELLNRTEEEASTSQPVKDLAATEDKPQKTAEKLSNDKISGHFTADCMKPKRDDNNSSDQRRERGSRKTFKKKYDHKLADQDKLICAIFMLCGNAMIWWEGEKLVVDLDTSRGRSSRGYSMTKYFTVDVRMELKREFLNLNQGSMSVRDYIASSKAGSKPRPAANPGKPEQQTGKQTQQPQRDLGVNPSTESNYKTAMNSNRYNADSMHEEQDNSRRLQPRKGAKELKHSSSADNRFCKERWPRCVYKHMGITHSSLHHTRIPDASTALPAVAQPMNCGSQPLGAWWLTDPSREMRVRYCRSPSHPGKNRCNTTRHGYNS
ncbi:hypothetical protein F511_23585 [Dorcoceras hygrometricum]|uniref:Uncharacterized protein n=1 Tax=Dorcoceras hygrometricum TaxID=472368 RepID=A0A2Z7BQM8_9LAMI|nr:hypothetical protein F511_23585 [Dorcoceras hygrometricum]